MDDANAAIERGLTAAMASTYTEALRLSSGPVSMEEIAHTYDHAYARRHGVALLDPLVINEQTGKFKSDWQYPVVTETAGDFEGELRNDSPVADFLNQGTLSMLGRDVQTHLQEFAETEAARLIEIEIAKL